MVLSDRTIREELEAGRIVIDPLGDDCIQPSSVDLHVDQYFRLFRNHTQRVIDVREDQEDLTELVEVEDDDPLVLHPGEFLLGSTVERVRLPDDLVARLEGKSSLGRLGPAHPLDGRVRRRRLGRPPHPRALQRGQPAHHVYPGMKIGQISFLRMSTRGRPPVRVEGAGLQVPGPVGPDAQPVLGQLPP